MSTEGISLVSGIFKAENFYIIDETTRLATLYDRRSGFSGYSSEILDLVPEEEAIKNSRIIVFGPKIKSNLELGSLTFHLKQISEKIRKDQQLINIIPVDKGRNEQMIETIEAVSGLSAGKEFGYHYFPYGSSRVMASNYEGKKEEWMASSGDMEGSEERFLIESLDSFSEKFRKVWLKRKLEMYYSYYVKGYYTLSLAANSFGKESPLTNLAKVMIKSIDDFADSILDGIKKKIKELSIKPVKAVIYLVWDVDQYELLGESEYFRARFVDKLNEYFSQTKLMTIDKLESIILNYQLSKEEILLVCDEISESRIKDKVDPQKLLKCQNQSG